MKQGGEGVMCTSQAFVVFAILEVRVEACALCWNEIFFFFFGQTVVVGVLWIVIFGAHALAVYR